MTTRHLDEMAWPAIDRVAATSILVVPLGSTEQHGPHLPVSTDTDIAQALVSRLAAHRKDMVVAPAVPYGSSGEHADFAGTLSVGADVLERLVVELVRSADAFAGVVLVSGHAGNLRPLAAAVATLRSEGRRVLGWLPRLDQGDAHAGRTETSLMLALRADAVATADAEVGNVRPIGELMPVLRRGGVGAVSPNGVLGDPSGANAGEGAALLDVLVADLEDAVRSWWCP
ncbi:MAG: mycofactocin biosynthesis peptidyl-dipeptidase MftE [Acidimicrobiia bacterium]